MDANALDELDRRLLNEFQRGFPMTPQPYRDVARTLKVDEDTVLERLRHLQEAGAVSRVGAIVAPQRVGWSTLAAMAVPPDELTAVADLVSGYPAVNHNYERDHCLNLWFVVTGADAAAVCDVLQEIEACTGLEVLDLPMLEAYRLDLGFSLRWT